MVDGIIAFDLTTMSFNTTENIKFEKISFNTGEYVVFMTYTKFLDTLFIVTNKLNGYANNLYFMNKYQHLTLLSEYCRAIALLEDIKEFFNLTMILILSFSFFLFVSLIVIVFMIYKKFKNKRKKYYMPISELPSMRNDQLLEIIKNDKNIPKIDTKTLQVQTFIGSGGQSVVYDGIYRGISVAIKSINPENINEVKILFSLDHKNILKTYGVCIEKEKIL